MNLLLSGKATPKEIILCTFTEKAAFEMRDRVMSAARKLGYKADMTDLRVGTIHGLCNRLLTENRHHTPLGSNYETLDDLTQLLFIYEHLDSILGDADIGKYLGRWASKWGAIEGARNYFNKITEELVDPAALRASTNGFLKGIGDAYGAYQDALFAHNRIDFAHLQSLVYDLLDRPEVAVGITRHVKYVMVDEYQDTNYIQERIVARLTKETGNLCVVGDEDQALYRFRGATVRNILEFPQAHPRCAQVKLTTNYRSHEKIVSAYDQWMATADWSNPKGAPFRFDKTILPNPDQPFPDYPAVFSIWGVSARDEAQRFADMVFYLKEQGVIADYNQVALLLHSVRIEHSGPYLQALEARGIPAYCPRARTYFDNDEVRLMVGCFAILFGYYGDQRGDVSRPMFQALAGYVDGCLMELGKQYPYPHPLAAALQDYVARIAALMEGETLDLPPSDFFYRFLALDPFAAFTKNENRARNLAIFSQLLNTFQTFYHYQVVSHRNRDFLRFSLFNSFLRFLLDGGINEYEDPDQPFPLGHVQVMTIHQSKGLEFPVIVVGSLDKQLSTAKGIDRELQPYYHRPPFEPESRITAFDRMRLYYVAFSRAEKVLVLSTDEAPKDHFATIFQGLPQWPYVKKDVLTAQHFHLKDKMPVKRAYSFTADLKLYETCPRQYEFFRELDFTPSRSSNIFFGLLVHQTIEEIHRIALDGQLDTVDEARIRALFDRTFQFLILANLRPIGEKFKTIAFRHVMNYFNQNRDQMRRVRETEVDVSVEKDDYILTGKVDLLLGGDGKLELLDFKTGEKPNLSAESLRSYQRQLCTYAHILEQRYGKRPERLYLYWTTEARRADALMEFHFDPAMIDEAAKDFDALVGKIEAHDFTIVKPPGGNVCRQCDMRRLCANEGIIAPVKD